MASRTPPPSRLGTASLSALAEGAPARRRRPPLVTALAAALVAGGSLASWQALSGAQVDSVPLPEQSYAAPVQQVVQAVEAAGEPEPTEAQERAALLAAMPASSVWVPRLEATAPVSGAVEFVPSRYEDLLTLDIPASGQEVGWYGEGAPLAGGEQGTTLLASHASTRSDPGVFRELHRVQEGDLVWTRDESGRFQAWAVHALYSLDHDEFPDEYFAADGVRQLVLTTCGGTLNAQGYYAQNVIAVASPVKVDAGQRA